METSDSDELDHRYYLWSDYDSIFSGVPVSCKNICTRKNSLIK